MAVGYVILLEVEIVGRLSTYCSLKSNFYPKRKPWETERGETTQPETKHRFSWQNNAQLAIMDCGYDLLSFFEL
ncbi:hypothetical protein CFP56_023494 [Quercus suber]|uniref:Uncharacterized protein n=1 Tax=Quercus suber TaxID=58331 RepID=A0AAW0K994_QUESU